MRCKTTGLILTIYAYYPKKKFFVFFCFIRWQEIFKLLQSKHSELGIKIKKITGTPPYLKKTFFIKGLT